MHGLTCITRFTGPSQPWRNGLRTTASHHCSKAGAPRNRRSDIAAILGRPSYAHLKAADATLAGTPEAAVAFLQQLAEVGLGGVGWA